MNQLPTISQAALVNTQTLTARTVLCIVDSVGSTRQELLGKVRYLDSSVNTEQDIVRLAGA